MNVETYEKPALKFVSVRNEEKIANTCWGFHGTGTSLYCDITGKGFVSFQIGGSSCELNLINVQYYGEDTNGDGKITQDDTSKQATTEQEHELYEILVNAGGNKGTSFREEGTIVIPGNPDGSWS